MKVKNKTTPFLDRSRSQRQQCLIEVKNGIRKHTLQLGGKFTTHQYIHNNGWADAFFLGKSKSVFYNLDIKTTQYQYKELVWDRAWEESNTLVPQDSSWAALFEVPTDSEYSGRSYLPRSTTYPEFGDLTRLQWAESQMKRIANSKVITVSEKWILDHDYAYGIGLHATIDMPYLTVDAINQFIDRFLQTENNFCGTEKLTYSFDAITNWGVDSNAVLDPLDWAAAEAEMENN